MVIGVCCPRKNVSNKRAEFTAAQSCVEVVAITFGNLVSPLGGISFMIHYTPRSL